MPEALIFYADRTGSWRLGGVAALAASEPGGLAAGDARVLRPQPMIDAAGSDEVFA